MPGFLPKQVRFAYNNLFHSPATPALSFTTSLSGDSDGPITPPFHSQPLPRSSTYPSGYYPSKPVRAPTRSEPVRPHPLLVSGVLTWNLLDHPSSSRQNYKPLSRSALAEPATFPPISYMKITSSHLPWTIKVYASNGSYITLEDVFETVYSSLRKNVTPGEFSSLPSANERRRATNAYEQRYRRYRSMRSYEQEKLGGMKRIDFLMGRTRFHGLSNHSRYMDEWSLHVS